MTYPTTKIAQRLKSLTDDPVVSLQNVLGFKDTGVDFLPIEGLDVSASALPYSKGALPIFDTDGSEVFEPQERSIHTSFFTAGNSIDGYTNPNIKFDRLYYRPKPHFANPAQEDFLKSEDEVVYPIPSSFREGGSLYERAAAGEDWYIGGIQASEFFNEFPPTADIDNGGTVVAGSGSALIGWINANVVITESPFVFDDTFYGDESAFYSNPSNFDADKHRLGLEVLTQFNSYPSATLIVDEIKSFPGEFSMLVYDSKRNHHFQLTMTQLVGILTHLGAAFDGLAGGVIPSVNLTMPLLTTAQLNAFYSSSTSVTSDLNGDGSVSTADLLEFLTDFGQEVDPPTIAVERVYNSFFALHGFKSQASFPFYQPNLIYQDEDIEYTSSQSFSEIDLVGQQPLVYSSDLGFNDLFQQDTTFANMLAGEPQHANLLLAIRGYDLSGGDPWNTGDYFDPPAEVEVFSYPAMNRFVCELGALKDVFNNWGTPELGRPLRVENYAGGDDGETIVATTAFNYYHPNASIISNGNLPQDFPLPPNWTNEFVSDYAPDYLIFSGGLDNPFADSLDDLKRPKVTISGYVECEEASNGKVLLYLISGASFIGDPLVGFFGFVELAANQDPYISSEGKERHPFHLHIDTGQWGEYADVNRYYSGYQALPNALNHWPSSVTQASAGQWNMYFSVGAHTFFDSGINKVVITSTVMEMLNTRGEVE